MEVLVISQYFWPENFPINDLASGLLERGCQLTVLTGIPNYPEGRFFPGYAVFKDMFQNYHGIKVIRVPLIPRGKGGRLCLALNYLSFALFASILGPFLCNDKYDLIFVYEPSPITVGLPALVLKKIKSIPIFFWVQDLWPESLSATGAVRSKPILKIVEKMVRFIYKRCDRVLVQSRAFFLPIERLGVDQSRISYFPNTTEKLYQPIILENDAPELGKVPSGFRIMFAGNIGAAQDFGTILEAAAMLKDYQDIQWVIIGDGRRRHWVEDQLKALGLAKTVHLLGRYPAEAMPRFFATADALLVTLKKDPIFALTIPSKIQSYLACGKPVIAALDGEGAKVITDSGVGLVCPSENPKALSESVLSMYKMPQIERQAMGSRAIEYFNTHFERDMLLDRLKKWFLEAH